MRSFHRQIIQAAPPPICIAIGDDVEAEIAHQVATYIPPRDPFLIAISCPFSPSGQHQAIFDCGDVVCPHCSTVLP